MADGQVTYILDFAPGIQRDGTKFDSRGYVDGQWVRFSSTGRPKKMGGFREVSDQLNGPIRGIQTWSRQSIIQVTSFSPWGVEAIQVDRNGIGQALYDRTPSGFAVDGNAIWQTDTMYDAAAGSDKTLLIVHPGSNLQDIDSNIARDVYYGDAAGTAPLQAIGGTAFVSGGIVAIPPFLVIYGSDGRVSWSNENEPRTFTSGSAGTTRVTGGKIVKALPIRGQGASPSALLWSLEAVFRMSYVGGRSVFRFDSVSQGSSILSSSSVVEHDGIFFWVGVGRFMMYDGRVKELPNSQNQDWFFDNLNYAQRQKVHVAKVPRYGEIWWFFPFGEAEECTHAVIYNVRGNFWYDVELGRSAGAFSQSFSSPILSDSTAKQHTQRLRMAAVTGYVVGSAVTGGTSTAQGTIEKILGNDLYVVLTKGAFQAAETVTGAAGGSSTISSVSSIELYQIWVHETGLDKIEGDKQVGISSFFETANFGFPIGGVEGHGGASAGPDRWTRLTRVEPDFNMAGNMAMVVVGGETAAGEEIESKLYPFDANTPRIDLREQRREIRLRFMCDESNGNYQMGKTLLHLEYGDIRS